MNKQQLVAKMLQPLLGETTSVVLPIKFDDGKSVRQTIAPYIHHHWDGDKLKTRTTQDGAGLEVYKYTEKEDKHLHTRTAVKKAKVGQSINLPLSESSYLSSYSKKFGLEFRLVEKKGRNGKYERVV